MAIFIGICFLYFCLPWTSCQFPHHIDLQKVSEIIFRNEKYNVLKPTLHIVRDHFEDVIMKRSNINYPTKRVFMDKNGFRHYWQGMELAPNLRKHFENTTDSIKRNSKNDTTTDTKLITKKVGPNRKKKKFVETLFIPHLIPKSLRAGDTLVKTTFFCPFFGTMTMMASVNLDKE